MLAKRLSGKVEFVVEENAKSLLSETVKTDAELQLRDVIDGDFDTEWLSYTLGIKVVSGVKEAIDHMRIHNASHSDAIMTNSLTNAELFINSVGSAAVYVNASHDLPMALNLV